MKKIALAASALLFSASLAAAADSPLIRARVDVTDAPRVARALISAGLDVLEGTIRKSSFELVVSADELALLRGDGFDVVELERGRPFKLILAEMEELGQVPPGYLNLAEIIDEMNDTANDHPGICQVVDLTNAYNQPATFEGRHIFAVKISDNVNADEDEPAFLMVSTHHAREIVTPVIALDAIRWLTDNYGSDPQVTDLVNSHEIWIAPVWNPDGYNWVFEGDNFWRKNRWNGIGVDLNRNYPFGWNTACAGSTNPGSQTYKGQSPASEPETQTMLAFSEDRHFQKIIDYHSHGRETLWSYACLTHPLDAFLRAEAIAISNEAGYFGDQRRPSAEGEHYQEQLARRGAYAFLMETHVEFQPSYASAQAESAMIWPATLYMLERDVSVSGHVVDAVTGDPLVAGIDVQELNFLNGETNSSGGPFARYHLFLPPGTYHAGFFATGYQAQVHEVAVSADSETTLDIALIPVGTNVVFPLGFAVQFGAYLEGDLLDLYNSNNGYLRIEQRPAFTPLLPLIRMTVDATSPTASPTSYTYAVETAATALPPNVPQRLELFNYDTSNWETVDQRTATLSDLLIEIDITTNAQRFIDDQTRAMRARLAWFDPGDVISPAWGVRIDQVRWEITP